MAVGGLTSDLKDFESSTWQPTGSTSSPWADRKSKRRMGLEGDQEGAQPEGEAAVNLPMIFPSAPEIEGLGGVDGE